MNNPKPTNVTGEPFTDIERRAASSLALVFILRMYGLFLLLPVVAIYVTQMPGAGPLLIGLAVGVYGLTQAVLQIPFGMASDRFGRKPLLVTGLLIFAAGSVVAALATTPNMVVFGRALQGAGAIAAVGLALAADLTRDSQRTKIMAIIGVSIGASFMLALLTASPLQSVIGVRGLFWMCALLALLAIILLWRMVPNPEPQSINAYRGLQGLSDVLRNGTLLSLDMGIFVLHLLMTAIFVLVPLALLKQAGLSLDQHWKVYVPAMLLSLALMLPLLMLSHRRKRTRLAMLVALLILAAGLLILGFSGGSIWLLGLGLIVFFGGFNTLEGILPSLLSRLAPKQSKGAALGVFSTCEFLGAFFGGLLGGYLSAAVPLSIACAAIAVLALAWLVVLVVGPDPAIESDH